MFVSLRKFNIPLSVMEQTSLSERLPARVQEYYLGWTCCFFFFFLNNVNKVIRPDLWEMSSLRYPLEGFNRDFGTLSCCGIIHLLFSNPSLLQMLCYCAMASLIFCLLGLAGSLV